MPPAIVLTEQPRPGTQGERYGFSVVDKNSEEPKGNESLVEIQAGAFNHR